MTPLYLRRISFKIVTVCLDSHFSLILAIGAFLLEKKEEDGKMKMEKKIMENNTQQQIKELTLLLLWLTSWKEKEAEMKIQRSWKGYDFSILNELRKKELINGSYKAKSVYLTKKGIKEAKKLEKKYLKCE